MSLFLAPIHQLMYDKIHSTDSLASSIAKEDDAIEKALAKNFVSIENAPLENVIDTSNIHGWLAERVALAEERLAFAATAMAKDDEEKLLSIVKQSAEKLHFQGTAEEAFQTYDSFFLNGMPCDQVHMPVNCDKGFAWQVTQNVHAPYYEDPELYERLIDSWWEGLLENTELHYEHKGDLHHIY